MSRPNTRSKLKKRITKILRDANKALTTDEITNRLREISGRSYPVPDYGKIRAALTDLLSTQRIERLEPDIPANVTPYSNRELQIVWAQYVKYQIPPLNRLAMIADEDEDA